MAKRITVIALLVILSACTLTLTGDRYAVQINQEGTFSAFNLATSTNTPRPTETPQIQLFITITARTNLRATASISSDVLRVISTNTVAKVLLRQGDWYRVSIPLSQFATLEGWVRNDRAINPITVTTTPIPTPTVIVTPTQEIILRIDVPTNGLVGYACQAEECARPSLYLSVYDDYRVVWLGENGWAWICVLASNGEDCLRQFYVRTN